MNPTPHHTRTVQELRRAIANTLLSTGATPNEVAAFLSGATMLGHLAPGGSKWYLEQQLALHLDTAHEAKAIYQQWGTH